MLGQHGQQSIGGSLRLPASLASVRLASAGICLYPETISEMDRPGLQNQHSGVKRVRQGGQSRFAVATDQGPSAMTMISTKNLSTTGSYETDASSLMTLRLSCPVAINSGNGSQANVPEIGSTRACFGRCSSRSALAAGKDTAIGMPDFSANSIVVVQRPSRDVLDTLEQTLLPAS